MFQEKLKQKYSNLKKVLTFIYSKYTLPAILRDITFLLSTASEIYGITVLGKFIDETTEILLNWHQFDLRSYFGTKSFLYLSLILTLWIVVQICKEFREYLFNVIFEKTWQDTQYNILEKVSSSNLEDVEKEEYQDMLTFIPAFSISKITSVYENFTVVISSGIRLLSAGIILFETMGWSILLLALFSLPELISTHLRRREIREYQDKEVGKLKYLNYIQSMSLKIAHFMELRVNNVYTYLKRKYKEEYDNYVGGLLKTLFNFTQDKILYSIIGEIMKYLYIIYVLAVTISKRLSFGLFKALFDYVDIVYDSIFDIINNMSIMSNNLGYVDEYFDFVEYQGFGDYSHGTIKLEEKTPTIEIKKLNFEYPDDPKTNILKNISLKIEPGEKIAFLGGDGSGRSTMVKILTGLYMVNKGEYLIDGKHVQDLARKQLKKKYSVTFQEFINYHFGLKENVVISGQRKNVDNELYKQVCTIAGVNEFRKKLKLKDKTILGKTFPSGKELSPGYWQRLAIARMLYRNRDIFLMDEPFTFIDDISARNILEGIFNFAGKDKSVIYITRSANFLDMFDRIYLFEKGQITESGTYSELIKKKGSFFNTQQIKKK